MNWKYWRQHLQLAAHPEGGFYRRIYAAPIECITAQGQRPAMTAIHYLLTGKNQSRWHRLKSDEHWFYHQGCGLELMSISPDGQFAEHKVDAGHPHLCITAGNWFCAQVQDKDADSFALVSCTVTPGFDFADFELIEAGVLAEQYPEYQERILQIKAVNG